VLRDDFLERINHVIWGFAVYAHFCANETKKNYCKKCKWRLVAAM